MLNQEELDKVVDSIRAAESRSSAEIRVCIARRCKGEPMAAAYKKFKMLKMDATAQRNSVLIYIAPDNQKTAIIADSGINKFTHKGFWDAVVEVMLSLFRDGKICDGLCRGIEKVGELVQTHYPASENDVNELCDDVVFDKE